MHTTICGALLLTEPTYWGNIAFYAEIVGVAADVRNKELKIMQGFWTVRFTGVQGWGTGVITLVGGRVFGGDSGFLYSGTYTDHGSVLRANVHVRPNGMVAIPNVMGRDEFDLELEGTMNGNTIAVAAIIPGTQLRLNGVLTKQGDLPLRP
jgi:hypothetical protein